jgi:hypothetical protein
MLHEIIYLDIITICFITIINPIRKLTAIRFRS